MDEKLKRFLKNNTPKEFSVRNNHNLQQLSISKVTDNNREYRNKDFNIVQMKIVTQQLTTIMHTIIIIKEN
jgi:hypothetical protein